MKQYASHFALAALVSALLVGCSSSNDEYQPAAKDTQLAAAAASTTFPMNLKAEDDPHLVAMVNAQSGDLTIRNFGTDGLANFDVWVNQAYVLHVNRLDPNSSRTIKTIDLYNSAGNNMSSLPPGSVRTVQIATNDGRGSRLLNVQGPQLVTGQ